MTMLLALTSFTHASPEFSALDMVERQHPTSAIILKGHPLTLEEVKSLGRIDITQLEIISLLANTLDLSKKKAPQNAAILELLTNSNLKGLTEIFKTVLDNKLISSEESFKILVGLKNSKIQSIKLNSILDEYFKKLLKSKIIEVRKALTPNATPQLIYLDLSNARKSPVKVVKEFEQFIFGLETDELVSDAVYKIHEIIAEEMEGKDYILQRSKLTQGNIREPYASGKISLSTNCGPDVTEFNKSSEVLSGRKSECEMEHFATSAYAIGLPHFSVMKDVMFNTGNLNISVGYELQARGGASCSKFLGRPKDCEDHTATAEVSLTGTFEMEECTDLYKCDIAYLGSSTNLKLLLDGKPLNQELIIRDRPQKVTWELKDKISHRGESNPQTRRNIYGVTFSVTNLEDRIDKSKFSYFPNITLMNDLKHSTQNESILFSIIDSLRELAEQTKNDPEFGVMEALTLYDYLRYLNTHKSEMKLSPKMMEALNLVSLNVSNRARELRTPILHNELKSKITQYEERYGKRSLYLTMLENLAHEDELLDKLIKENESLLKIYIPDYESVISLKLQEKKLVFKSLYLAELSHKDQLLKDIKRMAKELAQFEDVSKELKHYLN